MTYTNNLTHEKSPYLLQHAHNPIDWYAWGEEAFEKARQEDKPIFLSIGYSTCHWCHVMAHESFEDEEVAALMNEHYVAIKVDREERPDVDAVYMKVCQMMTGHGGWPLTIVITPGKIPFYAGTYFPRESRQGLPGIMEVLTQLSRIYHEDKTQLEEVQRSVQAALQQTAQQKSEQALTKEAAEAAYKQLAGFFDPAFAGFGTGQKFPQPQNLLFLLHYHHLTGERMALRMVEETLVKMAQGGIWDQLGYGFARYTVDRRWRTPHFEKMLYDNALLLKVYAAAYQMTGKASYRDIGEKIITFIEREMTSPEGGFYSALDADSEGEEGKYYVWDFREIYDLLEDDQADLFAEVYGVLPRGTFEGKNILRLARPDLDAVAQERGIERDFLETQLEAARETLLAERAKRVYPHRDDKILTSWNALMIAGLAHAARAFASSHALELAERALRFIEKQLKQEGRLMARYRDGETRFKAYLDDYAFLTWALLELHDGTFDISYLEKAVQYAGEMEELFWDEENGGFFFSGKDGEQLITQGKDIYEGAMPSGNSIAGVVYAKLYKLTGETGYAERLEEMYHAFHDDLAEQPSAAPGFMQSLLLSEYPGKEVIVLGSAADPGREELLGKIQTAYLPNTVVLAAEQPEQFQDVAGFAAAYPSKEGSTTVYICEQFACRQPTADLEAALTQILT